MITKNLMMFFGERFMKLRKSNAGQAFAKPLRRAVAFLNLCGIVLLLLQGGCLWKHGAELLHHEWILYSASFTVIVLLWVLALRVIGKKIRETEDAVALIAANTEQNDGKCDLYRVVQEKLEAEQELAHVHRMLEKQLEKLTLQSCVRDTYVAIEQVEHRLDMETPYIMGYVHVEFAESFRMEIRELGKTTFFLKELIALYLENFVQDATVFQIESDQIVFVLSNTAEIERILLMLQDKLDSEAEYANFTFVVSDVHYPHESVKEVYDRLCSIAKYRIPGSKTRVLRESQERVRTERTAFDGELRKEFLEAMQNETIEYCTRFVSRLIDRSVSRGGTGVELQLLCSEVSVSIDELLCELFGSIPEELGSLNACLKFSQAITPEQYKKTVGDYICNAVTYLRLHRRTEDHIIGFILDYVEKHYEEDIYLNLFAEKLQLTAAYISSYFKEKMNVNLSDYINHFRVRKAIGLMETTNHKNKDIAQKVGLPNINTFIRLFKKHAGTTPGEYRKHHAPSSTESFITEM